MQRVPRLLQRHKLTVAVERPFVHIGAEKHSARLQRAKNLAMPPHIVGRIEIAEDLDRVDEVLGLIAGRQVRDRAVGDELRGHPLARELAHLGARLDPAHLEASIDEPRHIGADA